MAAAGAAEAAEAPVAEEAAEVVAEERTRWQKRRAGLLRGRPRRRRWLRRRRPRARARVIGPVSPTTSLTFDFDTNCDTNCFPGNPLDCPEADALTCKKTLPIFAC